MLKIFLLGFLAISWDAVSGGGLDLPFYISKCSLSDPKLEECLIEKANKAIPIIAKGDANYNIPPISPIKYAEAPLNGNGIKYVLYNVSSDDWKKLVVTYANFDLKNGVASLEGTVDRLEGIAENYAINEGKIIDIPVYGHGKYNMTFVNAKVRFGGNIRLYKNGDDEYLDYFNSWADMTCDRAYFYFENLQSTERSDVNAYIDENWEKFFAQTKPALENYCNAFIHYPVRPIISAVPFNKIFLP